MVAYTNRYSCRHLIPIIQLCQDELRGLMPTTGVGDHPCFFTFYNYDP